MCFYQLLRHQNSSCTRNYSTFQLTSLFELYFSISRWTLELLRNMEELSMLSIVSRFIIVQYLAHSQFSPKMGDLSHSLSN